MIRFIIFIIVAFSIDSAEAQLKEASYLCTRPSASNFVIFATENQCEIAFKIFQNLDAKCSFSPTSTPTGVTMVAVDATKTFVLAIDNNKSGNLSQFNGVLYQVDGGRIDVESTTCQIAD